MLNPWCDERLPERDLAFYIHVVEFFSYALRRRAANLVRRPELIPMSIRQIVRMPAQLFRRRRR